MLTLFHWKSTTINVSLKRFYLTKQYRSIFFIFDALHLYERDYISLNVTTILNKGWQQRRKTSVLSSYVVDHYIFIKQGNIYNVKAKYHVTEKITYKQGHTYNLPTYKTSKLKLKSERELGHSFHDINLIWSILISNRDRDVWNLISN